MLSRYPKTFDSERLHLFTASKHIYQGKRQTATPEHKAPKREIMTDDDNKLDSETFSLDQ